jgi:hypothetical protein
MVERKELLLAAKWAAWMVFATADSTALLKVGLWDV